MFSVNRLTDEFLPEITWENSPQQVSPDKNLNEA